MNKWEKKYSIRDPLSNHARPAIVNKLGLAHQESSHKHHIAVLLVGKDNFATKCKM